MIDVAKKRMLLHTAQYMMRKWTEMARREAERRLYNKNPEYLGTSPTSGSGQLDQDLGTCLEHVAGWMEERKMLGSTDFSGRQWQYPRNRISTVLLRNFH
jgi:hypothetical protein